MRKTTTVPPGLPVLTPCCKVIHLIHLVSTWCKYLVQILTTWFTCLTLFLSSSLTHAFLLPPAYPAGIVERILRISPQQKLNFLSSPQLHQLVHHQHQHWVERRSHKKLRTTFSGSQVAQVGVFLPITVTIIGEIEG